MKNFRFRIHENNYNVKIVSHEEDVIELEVNGTSYSVKMKDEIKKTKTPTLILSKSKRPSEPLKVNPSAGKTKISAPIPGIILSIDVKIGDEIKVGDRLLVLEAMKMENNITSEKTGTVSAIHVKIGQQVLQSELMIELA
ncbi:MAG: acetyl-CoA carboxylase biotin carboxyl carrier protein subunit [Bacteroidetes bacterium HGW-Bacteroidetes-3]|jgi:biotin carboxyl carrier protein|nr:MAG: acetyl-CoA carboxylase biotin carboxyl carrier protein subunit [Bacteroidetes bacterium HGW-Bacteroidetes-3]